MSGIYIPGMETPQSCAFCPLASGCYCAATEEDRYIGSYQSHQTKPGFCPLVEVPPHGALKDADAMWGQMKGERALKKHCPKSRSIIYDTGFLAGYRAACQIASKMPIIIPADPADPEEGE